MNALLFVSVAALIGAGPEDGHHHGPQLGKVTFESTCSAAAEPHLQRGFGWLHSFEYGEAARSFSEAAVADPRCGIAHWGVAMSYYHPLWAPPSPAELEQGSAAVARAKKASAASAKERDLIAAIDFFYQDADNVDHRTRALAYTEEMAKLHQRYPTDDEVAVFYALSLIAAGTMDSDPAFEKENEAGAILNAVLARNADHPGVAHYLIHSFDYPSLAHLAVPAARRYADIAPASPHAQHMPSHIFVRLGLWEDAIKSNLASEAAARDFAKAQGLPDSSSERLHAMDYLAYAYLQTGQDSAAEGVLSSLNQITRADPPVFSVAYAATAIPARLVLERRNWKQAAELEVRENVLGLAPLANYQWAQAHIHFARVIGSARSGDAGRAREELAKLRAIEESLTVPPGTYDWRKQVSIERQVGDAWLAFAEGRREAALAAMQAAADLDDATEKHPVTPGSILPAREQLGELLLELGRPVEALAAFEESLKRAPRRLGAFYGAARSAKLAGDQAKARHYFADLADLTKGSESTRAEIREAKDFEAEVAAR